MDRSHDIGCDGIGGRDLGNAEIGHLDFAFFGNNDILGLDVPVDDVIPVGRFQSHGDLDGDGDCLLNGQSLPGLDIFFQRDAVHELHDDKINAFFLADIIYIYNIRMHQSRGGLGLHTELGYETGIFRKFLLQDLDRHQTVEFVVLGFIDIRHAAAADLFQNLVSICNEHSYLNHVFLR